MNNFIKAVVSELVEKFNHTKYKADILAKNLFKEKRLGKRDRNIAGEAFFTYIRNKRLIDETAEFEKLNKIDVLNDFIDNKLTSSDKLIDKLNNENEKNALKYSFPLWLFELLVKEYGEDTAKVAQWFNTRAIPSIRYNSAKINGDKLIKLLNEENIIASHLNFSPVGLKITSGESRLSSIELFKKGYYEPQDESSQITALLTDGKMILDACAGGGGKSIAIASIYKDTKIIATDIRENLFKKIAERARRNGVKVETKPIEAALKMKFDTVLIDAPCSGLGVLRRNPDDKWRITKTKLETLKKEQKKCLETYSRTLKTGGKLIYLTCSCLKEENEEQIQDFLNKNKNFKLLDASTIIKRRIGEESYKSLTEKEFYKIKPFNGMDIMFGAILEKM